jgi:hypothetical protein
MAGKRRKGRNPAPSGTGMDEELFGLDPAVWSVTFWYAKGFLSGARFAHVRVTHTPTGRSREASFEATGKGDARRQVVARVRRFVAELGG